MSKLQFATFFFIAVYALALAQHESVVPAGTMAGFCFFCAMIEKERT